MALVARPLIVFADNEVHLRFKNRTCRTPWPDGQDMPEGNSLWLLDLDIDCRIHGVVRQVRVETLDERWEWLEAFFQTKARCDVDQVAPSIILSQCMYARDAAFGVNAIGGDKVKVRDIDPIQQGRLRLGKPCEFTFDRLVWDEEGQSYEPLHDDWRTPPVSFVDCRRSGVFDLG